MPGGRRFWLVLLALLVANYVIAGLVSHNPSRESVPYSYFREQVTDGNVVRDHLDRQHDPGRLQEGGQRRRTRAGRASTRFKTERPAFVDDALLGLLEQQDVVINAAPDRDGARRCGRSS